MFKIIRCHCGEILEKEENACPACHRQGATAFELSAFCPCSGLRQCEECEYVRPEDSGRYRLACFFDSFRNVWKARFEVHEDGVMEGIGVDGATEDEAVIGLLEHGAVVAMLKRKQAGR